MTLYLGQIQPLPPQNRPTGMFKQPAVSPVWLGPEGFSGDEQADRRVHGGPEKALHQYPRAHYARLAQRFAEAAPALVPGAMGENLSFAHMDETTVHIGDTFALGEAVIQISRPRSPCWKIDARFDAEGMAVFIDQTGLTGWYFRVLQSGWVAPDADLKLLTADPSAYSVADLLALQATHRPAPEMLEQVAAIPALNAEVAQKLRDRAARLRRL